MQASPNRNFPREGRRLESVGAFYNLRWMGRFGSLAQPSVIRVMKELSTKLSSSFTLHTLWDTVDGTFCVWHLSPLSYLAFWPFICFITLASLRTSSLVTGYPQIPVSRDDGPIPTLTSVILNLTSWINQEPSCEAWYLQQGVKSLCGMGWRCFHCWVGLRRWTCLPSLSFLVTRV